MHNADDNSHEHLGDAQLLAREISQRDEFCRLDNAEPHLRDTTYGLVRGSRQLIESWERWWKTNLAARLRGLLPRPMGR